MPFILLVDVIVTFAVANINVTKLELDVAEADISAVPDTVLILVPSNAAVPTASTRASNGLTLANAVEAVEIASTEATSGLIRPTSLEAVSDVPTAAETLFSFTALEDADEAMSANASATFTSSDSVSNAP
jgi:hypothetical protein